MKAFILMNVNPGANKRVAEQLRKLDEVAEANMTFGPYDVVAIVNFKDLKELGEVLDSKVQPVPGVVDTLTCLATE